MSAVYRLATIADLLKVPVDRREQCFRNLEYALALHELAWGERAIEAGLQHIEWTDDGKMDSTAAEPDGTEILTMKIVKDKE